MKFDNNIMEIPEAVDPIHMRRRKVVLHTKNYPPEIYFSKLGINVSVCRYNAHVCMKAC